MAKKGSLFKTAYMAITMLAVTGALSAATYAWFTKNRIVKTTDKVTARTDTSDIKLLLSSTGGADFRGEKEASISVVNQSQAEYLMPVSTYDLKTFLYNPNTIENKASYFVKMDTEKYIFHGRLFLKAEAVNQPEGTRMALYLDEALSNGGSFLQNVEGYMVNAARLGLTFDGENPLILRFSEENNPEDYTVENTIIDGDLVRGNFVLIDSDGVIDAVADPSEKYTDYLMGDETAPATVKPLLYMELNREYVLDIYFYLEGCDPDCSDITEQDNLDFHLGFYGVVEG